MMKQFGYLNLAYSYSKLSLFKQCPHRYKLNYIDKIAVPQDASALVKGRNVHSILENYESFVKEGCKPKENEQYSESEVALNFAKSELGKDILEKPSAREYCVKFDANLNAADHLNQRECYFIGYIDRINRTPNGIELIDYKTGQYKQPGFQDYMQLAIYSLYMFSKYPEINEILLRYVYVEHSKENTKLITRAEVPALKKLILNDIAKIESETEYPKKPHKLCNWCPYKELCKPNI